MSTSTPRALRPRGALWCGPDLVHRRLAAAVSAPALVVLARAEPLLLQRAAPGERGRRAGVRVVREALPVGRVEEREGLAPARAGGVGSQASVDDPALVPQPVLHLPQRLRRRRGWPPPTAALLRDGRTGLAVLLRGRSRRPLVAVAAPGGGGAGRRGGPRTVMARGAEGRGPLGVEGPPARLVREARVRLPNEMHATSAHKYTVVQMLF